MDAKLGVHNKGQRDGSEATLFDELATEWSPFVTAEYKQGFRHARGQQNTLRSRPTREAQAQPSAPRDQLGGASTHAGPGGGGAGIDDAALTPIAVIIGAYGLVIMLCISVVRWCLRHRAHAAIFGLWIAIYLLANYVETRGNPQAAIVIGLMSLYGFFATLGHAIGKSKRRPLLGLVLGFFVPVWGHIIAVLLPLKQAAKQPDIDARDLGS